MFTSAELAVEIPSVVFDPPTTATSVPAAASRRSGSPASCVASGRDRPAQEEIDGAGRIYQGWCREPWIVAMS